MRRGGFEKHFKIQHGHAQAEMKMQVIGRITAGNGGRGASPDGGGGAPGDTEFRISELGDTVQLQEVRVDGEQGRGGLGGRTRTFVLCGREYRVGAGECLTACNSVGRLVWAAGPSRQGVQQQHDAQTGVSRGSLPARAGADARAEQHSCARRRAPCRQVGGGARPKARAWRQYASHQGSCARLSACPCHFSCTQSRLFAHYALRWESTRGNTRRAGQRGSFEDDLGQQQRADLDDSRHGV